MHNPKSSAGAVQTPSSRSLQWPSSITIDTAPRNVVHASENAERDFAPISSLAAGYEGLRLPAAVLLDNVRSMYNVGAFFRAADGVGLEKLCLCGITAHPPKKAITKTALGAEEVVAWEHDWDVMHVAEKLRLRGFEIAAIETSGHSVDLFDWQPRFPLCVAFGNEVEGLRPELLELAETHVRIPMLGKKTSLNVATAAGIVLYELLRKYRLISAPFGADESATARQRSPRSRICDA